MMLFERHLIKKLEQWICENDQCNGNVEQRRKNKELVENGGDIPFQYAVADLQLAFDNKEMMVLLEKRANFLQAGKFDKANEMEVEMTALKTAEYENLTRPKTFFCTFHQEHAYR